MPIAYPYTPVEPITETYRDADDLTRLFILYHLREDEYTFGVYGVEDEDGYRYRPIYNQRGVTVARVKRRDFGVYQERVQLDANGIRVVT